MMEKYESICTVGEGSYGVVLKCKDKTNGSVVAIKKFLETDNDKAVKKIATREIKILKMLRHENLVNLIEVFRKNRRIYLVFEFIEHNLLEEIEKSKIGLGENRTREIMYQVVRGIDFMHSNNIIHRDLKPENVLINKNGLIKLCDFGFARHIALPTESHTDYVATRWYRSPELLVGDTKYGKPVDIWSIGVLTYEVLTSRPLFPGESDLDQLYLIINSLGDITESMKVCFQNNQFYLNVKLPRIKNFIPLQNKLRRYSPNLIKFIMDSLIIDPEKRLTSSELLEHDFFTSNSWVSDFRIKLKKLITLHETNVYRPSNVNQTELVINAINHSNTLNKSQMLQQQQHQHQSQQNINNNSNNTNGIKQHVYINNANTPASNQSIPINNNYNIGGAKNANANHNTNHANSNTNITSNNSNQNHSYTYENGNDASINENLTSNSQLNLNATHHMSKVNITFNNQNTESKTSFTSNLQVNESSKKNKLLSDSLTIIKQSNNKETMIGSQEASNKSKKFLPKIEPKTPESAILIELQHTNNSKNLINYNGYSNVYSKTINNNNNNPNINMNAGHGPSNKLSNYSTNNGLSKKTSNNNNINNNIDFNMTITNSNSNGNTSNGANSDMLNNTRSAMTTNSSTTNVNESSPAFVNRSNTNHTLNANTNLINTNGSLNPNSSLIDTNGLNFTTANSYYVLSENFKLNKKSNLQNLNEPTKQIISNRQEAKLNTNSLNGLRLPQMYTTHKATKNFLYENKKPFLMQVNKK